MYTHPQFGQSTAEIQMLRQQAGRWLRALRERAGMSQRELAKAVGFEYYTFISQLEGGRGRLPPAQYLAFAEALEQRAPQAFDAGPDASQRRDRCELSLVQSG